MEPPVDTTATDGPRDADRAVEHYVERHGALRRALSRARGAVLKRTLRQGIGKAGGVLLGTLAAALVAVVLKPTGWTPIVVLGLLGVIAFVTLVVHILLPWSRVPSLRRYARAIDEHFRSQGERNDFLAALELGAGPARRGTSSALVDALVEERVEAVSRLDLGAPGRRPLGRGWGMLAAAGAIALLALLLITPSGFVTGLGALANPRLPSAGTVYVRSLTGDVLVERGSPVTIVAEAVGSDTEPSIHVRRGAGVWRQFAMVAVDESMVPDLVPGPAASSSSPAAAGSSPAAANPSLAAAVLADRARTLHQFTIPGIDQETRYRVRLKQATSLEHRIGVIEPLRIVRHQLRYQYPDYAQLDAETVEAHDGHVAALPGTRVEVVFETNQPLGGGTLEISGGAISALDLLRDREARGTLVVEAEGEYVLRVQRADEERSGVRESVFGPYTIMPSPDREPLIAILDPGEDIDLPRDMTVDLTVHAADDYGLSSLHLHYSYEGGEPVHQELRRFTGYPREMTETFAWNLAELDLLPGDLVTYYLELYDNDTISGPKRARTRSYTVRFPTMPELYAEVEEVHDQSENELEQALERGEQLKESLEDIAREMRKFPETTWEDRKEIERIIERQEALREQLSQVSESLGEALQRLENQELVNEEVLDKLVEIEQMMEQITDPELREAMKRLGESMSQLDPNEISQALNELELTQEQLLQNLERTLEMLRQVQMEEKLERAVQLAEDMLDKQEQVNEGLDELGDDEEEAADEQQGDEGADDEGGDEEGGEEADDQQSDQEDGEQPSDNAEQGGDEQTGDQPPSLEDELMRLSEMEEQALEDAEALQQLLEELAERLAEQNQPPADELSELAEQSKPNQPMQMNMQQAMEQMAQQNSKGAQQSGENAEQQMQSMLSQMRMAQSMMMNQMALEALEKLRDAARQLLWISDSEEAMLVDEDGKGAPHLAERQHRLLEGARKVNALIEEVVRTSMLVETSFAGVLGQPLKSMENATRSFERGNRSAGRLHAFQALTQVNEALLDLLEEEQSMCQGAGGTGSSLKQSLMQMAGLSEQQSQVNQGMQKLLRQRQGGQRLSESARGRLARLAAQQRAIQQGLENVSETVDERRDVLGRLGDMAAEMDDIAQEMEREHIDERILRKQEQFLSRLLDAQRSIRKRDLGKERRSRTGEELRVERPQALPEELLSIRERLEADILRGRSDVYPPEYRELVERYFRSLSARGMR